MADGVEILDVRVADDLFFAPQDEDIADITMGRCPAQRSTMSRAEALKVQEEMTAFAVRRLESV